MDMPPRQITGLRNKGVQTIELKPSHQDASMLVFKLPFRLFLRLLVVIRLMGELASPRPVAAHAWPFAMLSAGEGPVIF